MHFKPWDLPFWVYGLLSFSNIIHLCTSQHNSDWEHFHNPQKWPWAYLQSIPLTQSLATIGLLSISMDWPFWSFRINGIIQHVAFYILLLSPGIMFPSFIHVPACVMSLFPFYCWRVLHCMDRSLLFYPFFSWWTFWLFPVFDYYK